MLTLRSASLLSGDVALLDHSLAEFGPAAIFMRLIDATRDPAKKRQRAKNFALGGFHVSVARGLAGGCKDLASFYNGTAPPKSCAFGLGRADVKDAWASAAEAYRGAALAAKDATQPIADVMGQLRAANAKADAAYALEGIEPPRDPVLVQAGLPAPAEPPAAKTGFLGPRAGVAAAFGFSFLTVLAAALSQRRSTASHF